MSSEDPVEFARRLGRVFRNKREEKGWSQNRLSEVAGVSRTGVLMFERGERSPSVHIAKAMATALGIPLSKLVAEAEREDSTSEA